MGSELGVRPDSKPQANVDAVSIWWATWACFWTVAVVLGMAFLVVNRNAPPVRIRGIKLSLAAMVLLHLYWVSVQFGTMSGSVMPGDAEFWIMGLYLSCGMGLFHASNTQFIHVANVQKKYARRDSSLDSSNDDCSRKGSLLDRFRRLEYSVKVFIIVGVAMVFQIFLTCLMYIISRKWHSSWGIPGTEVHGSPMQQKTEMGRGWEWWPTIVWQFVWAWIVAPITLWKSRHIHDTQGWRVQTIGCAVANLHATPMWLVALYVPAFEKVNKYFIPPQWICLSIMFIEIFTIFVPCWEVVRSRSLKKETLDAIANWEKRSKGSGSESKSMNTMTTVVESMLSGKKSTDGSFRSTGSDDSVLTMSALEYVLERNPTPLLEFSALHDFSGENIAFLSSVAEWKNSFPKTSVDDDKLPKGDDYRELVRERFNRALRIYTDFISVRDAQIAINISSQTTRVLENIFERPARILYGERREIDNVTPFGKPRSPPASSDGSEIAVKTSAASSAIEDRVQYWGEVPDEFDETVFDDAESSIKYLVLTNTWAKFIQSRSARNSTDTLC